MFKKFCQQNLSRTCHSWNVVQISQRHAVMTEACFQTFRKSPIFTKCSKVKTQPSKVQLFDKEMFGHVSNKPANTGHYHYPRAEGQFFSKDATTTTTTTTTTNSLVDFEAMSGSRKNVWLGLRNHFWVLKYLQCKCTVCPLKSVDVECKVWNLWSTLYVCVQLPCRSEMRISIFVFPTFSPRRKWKWKWKWCSIYYYWPFTRTWAIFQHHSDDY